MAFKFIQKGEDSHVRRTYACDECEIEWTQWVARDSAVPACPSCALAAQDAVTSPALLSNKSKAVDIAQGTMEAMGYTDFNDNQRKGDIAAKMPTAETTAAMDSRVQAETEMARATGAPALSNVPAAPGGLSQADMMKSFWGGGVSAPNPGVSQALTGAAMAGAAQARAEGSDPMALLHAKKPPLKLDVVATDKGRTGPRNIP